MVDLLGPSSSLVDSDEPRFHSRSAENVLMADRALNPPYIPAHFS